MLMQLIGTINVFICKSGIEGSIWDPINIIQWNHLEPSQHDVDPLGREQPPQISYYLGVSGCRQQD